MNKKQIIAYCKTELTNLKEIENIYEEKEKKQRNEINTAKNYEEKKLLVKYRVKTSEHLTKIRAKRKALNQILHVIK